MKNEVMNHKVYNAVKFINIKNATNFIQQIPNIKMKLLILEMFTL